MWRGHGADSDTRPTKLYVLFRVSNVGNGSRPKVKAYVDAHDLIVRGHMQIESDVQVKICGEEI